MRLFSALIALALFTPCIAPAGVMERVAETKTLRIGYRVDAPPFSFQGNDGKANGYSVDLCRAVADSIKHDLKLETIAIQYVTVTAENRFKAIETGAIDLLCGPTSATISRREIVDFSLPIFVDGAGLMVREGLTVSSLSDLATKKLAVRGGTTTERALRSSFPNADIAIVRDHRMGISLLKEGAADAYFADRTVLAFLKATDADAANLMIAQDYLTIEPYALALPKGDSAFRLSVDKAISRVFTNRKLLARVQRSFGDVELGNLVKALYRIIPLPN